MTDEKSRDRRRSQRVELVLKVAYQQPEDLLSDYITNLGEGGIFIHTKLPFEEGQRISFSLSFPGLLEPIDFGGVVRWRRKACPDTDTTPGLGIELLFTDDQQEKRLRSLLDSSEEQDKKKGPVPFRVLLVEDNEFARELFAYAIESMPREQVGPHGLEVVTAVDGKEALAQLEREPV